MEKVIVLLVEDEAIIRMETAQMLEDDGYTVIEASNADRAIAILHSRNDIRAVITDINMPGSMNGIELVRLIRDRWPPIVLIVMSSLVALEGDGLPTDLRHIRKPYESVQVTATLRELVN